MTTTDMRAEFEAWADDQPEFVVKDLQRYADGQYGHATAQVAWAVWQAAYAAGRNAKREPLSESQAARDVLAERARQISVEGWTPEHDDEYSHGQLALAASCYCGTGPIPQGHMYLSIPGSWPWDLDWWKPRDYRRNLVRAGALILAEIERLDRAHGIGADHKEG